MFLEIDQHNEPEKLKQQLQTEIDSTVDADLILLLYGICGNATKGIQSNKIPVVIPRVHDCATILLGGKTKYKNVFGHRPSQGWKCLSYDKEDIHNVSLESNPIYIEYKEKYGEDNALYLFEMLFPKTDNELYISLGLQEDEARMKSLTDSFEIIEGSLDYLKRLLQLVFEDTIILQENEQMVPLYDETEVMSKK